MRLFRHVTFGVVLGIAALASAQGGKPANQVKGQGQLAGAAVEFGTVYSLKNRFNFAILSAAYSVEPYDAYETTFPRDNEKLFVIDIAIKNAAPEDNFFDVGPLMTIVDDAGQLYEGGSYTLTSKGHEAPNFNLRPGQGLGQAALKDPLRVAFRIPAKVRIEKIMINQGRLNSSEQVLRYLLVPAPPKPAATPAVKNFAAPLPEGVRDASDPWGAKALPEGKAKLGQVCPSGVFTMAVKETEVDPDEKFNGEMAEEGRTYFVMTVTATQMVTEQNSFFELTGGDNPVYMIVDADGEKYHPIGYRKASSDEEPERTFEKGESLTYRVFFNLPKGAKPVKAKFGAGAGRVWTLDL